MLSFVSLATSVAFVCCCCAASVTAAATAAPYKLITRTFAGHETRLRTILFETMNMFVDPSLVSLTVVLDDDATNRRFGERLKAESAFPLSIAYESPPSCPLRSYGYPMGYHWQMWSTYYLDRYAGGSPIIGIVDSDTTFFSVFVGDDVMDAAGRIIVRAVRGSHWMGDYEAFRNNRSISLVDTMWTDRMPQWIFTSHFSACRQYLTQIHGASDFDEAYSRFQRVKGFPSPANVLLSCAVLLFPEKYHVVLPTDSFVAVSVAQNHVNWKYVCDGCRRSWNVDNCVSNFWRSPVLEYNHVETVWPPEASATHDKLVLEHVRHMGGALRNSMTSGCEAHFAKTTHWSDPLRTT